MFRKLEARLLACLKNCIMQSSAKAAQQYSEISALSVPWGGRIFVFER